MNYQDIADDFAEFIKQLNLEKPVFYGFSDGGIAGLIIAAQHPDLLSKLIVSGANVTPDGLKNRWQFWFRLLYFFTRDKKIKMMLNQPDISNADLQNISVPTLILAAEKDLIKERHTRRIVQHIADSTLKIIPAENH